MEGSEHSADNHTHPPLRGWRFWIRPVVFVLYSIIFLIALPLLCVDLYFEHTKPQVVAWFVAGIFVIVTVPISLWTIINHLIYFTQPELQKPIMRILWMVPVYAIDSWFAIKFPSLAIYFDTVRECYEAYVIYNFMVYLLNYLTREFELAGTLGNKSQQRHVFPFCCFPSWPMGGVFMQRCKQGVLQYTLIRPLTTVIALICELTGKYHDGEFDPRYAWLYIMIINNISQIWAMYCLVLFYLATKQELQPIKPVGKFICVKLVIFASFWQGIAVSVVVAVINIQPSWGWTTKEQFANAIQDLLICFEMFVAAIAHHYTFSYEPFITDDHNIPWYRSIRNMFDISDVREDVADHVTRVGIQVREVRPPWKRKAKLQNTDADEKTALLSTASSDGDLANILGYGGGQCGFNSNSHTSENEGRNSDNSSVESNNVKNETAKDKRENEL